MNSTICFTETSTSVCCYLQHKKYMQTKCGWKTQIEKSWRFCTRRICSSRREWKTIETISKSTYKHTLAQQQKLSRKYKIYRKIIPGYRRQMIILAFFLDNLSRRVQVNVARFFCIFCMQNLSNLHLQPFNKWSEFSRSFYLGTFSRCVLSVFTALSFQFDPYIHTFRIER